MYKETHVVMHHVSITNQTCNSVITKMAICTDAFTIILFGNFNGKVV